jgi:hypothetical protein
MKRDKCPCCHCTATKPTSVRLYNKANIYAEHGAQIVECVECNTQYVDVVPDHDRFIEQYSEEYYPVQTGGEKRFKDHFPGVSLSTSCVLEVGGGRTGVRAMAHDYFDVDISADTHWSSSMFDLFNDQDADLCRDLNIDTIVSCDCIEHVLYPDRFFDVAHKILRPGGVLYVQIGDFLDVVRSSKRQSAHINALTLKSLKFMTENKFKIVNARQSAFTFERLG